MGQLLNSNATTYDIFSQVSQMLTRLDPTRDVISDFTMRLRSKMLSAPPFRIPDREHDPTAWPSADDEIDAEQDLDLGTLPIGLDMVGSRIFGFVGSKKSLLVVVSWSHDFRIRVQNLYT